MLAWAWRRWSPSAPPRPVPGGRGLKWLLPGPRAAGPACLLVVLVRPVGFPVRGLELLGAADLGAVGGHAAPERLSAPDRHADRPAGGAGPRLPQVVDPDMLTFEDEATVACHFQAHSFEDRILKIDRIRIGRGATVGDNAVVFYGAEIGRRAWVAPHSVVMKRDSFRPAGNTWDVLRDSPVNKQEK